MTIPNNLLAILSNPSIELCRLYWIRRTDKKDYLYTDWPSPLTVSIPVAPFGIITPVLKTFNSVQAPKVSALVNDTTLSVANTEYQSYYTDDIPVGDIKSGRFDGAEVLFYLCCPTDTSAVWLLQSGYAGEMQDLGNELFKMGFRSIAQLLQQQVGKTVTELCPYKLGEPRCGYLPSKATGTVISVNATAPRRTITATLDSLTQAQSINNFWQYGIIEVTNATSQNRQLQSMIIKSTQQGAETEIKLLLSTPFDFAIGDKIEVLEGCANTIAACQGRSNVINFGGFPYVPGTDQLVSSSQG